MATTPRFGYLIAVAATLTAVALRLALTPLLGNELPYLTFFGAIMVAGWYGGFKPGLVATVLSAAATSSLFLAPRLALHQFRAGDVVGLLVFVSTGCLISLLCERLHHARNGQQLEAERLRTTLQSIGDGVIVTDEAGRIISLNPVAEGLTGWRDAEARGRVLPEVFRILNEETRSEVENPALRALREGAIVGLANHTVLLAKNGEEHPIDDSAAPVRNRGGDIIGSILVFRDVAARRTTNEMRGLLAAVVESSEDAVISKSLDGHIMSWNAGAQDMFGYTAEEAIGRYVGFLMPEELLQEEQALLARVGRGERVTTFETVRCTKDGQRLDVSLSLSPIRNESRRHHRRLVDRPRHPPAEGARADAARDRSAQGRLPGDARPRAAQPAGADPQQRRRPPPGQGRRPAAAPDLGDHRAASAADGAPPRRPAGRLAHYARQAGAAQRAGHDSDSS